MVVVAEIPGLTWSDRAAAACTVDPASENPVLPALAQKLMALAVASFTRLSTLRKLSVATGVFRDWRGVGDIASKKRATNTAQDLTLWPRAELVSTYAVGQHRQATHPQTIYGAQLLDLLGFGSTEIATALTTR
jgi:hypothetical protein